MAHGIALITINATVFVLGSLGNLLVCLAIATNFHLRRASSYLLFSLAIADLIVTLICEPLLMEFIIQRTFFHECKASLERPYVFPLRHKNLMEKFGLKVMLIVSWSILIFQLILLFVFWCVIPSAFYSAATFLFWGPAPSAISLFSFSTFWSWYFCCVTRGKESNSGELETFLWNWIFPHGGSCFLYAGYSNRYFHRLLGSLDNCNVCHNDWKTTFRAGRPFGHVAKNPGSVKLTHELSDLLC